MINSGSVDEGVHQQILAPPQFIEAPFRQKSDFSGASLAFFPDIEDDFVKES
ncbi:MAG TPA: hypothetical protein VFE61_16205 [Candidatus Sulfotelmatobacter sp.]|nr:hypothetical protein [Candidatus Sulfotelmatobacter sp.]